MCRYWFIAKFLLFVAYFTHLIQDEKSCFHVHNEKVGFSVQ